MPNALLSAIRKPTKFELRSRGAREKLVDRMCKRFRGFLRRKSLGRDQPNEKRAAKHARNEIEDHVLLDRCAQTSHRGKLARHDVRAHGRIHDPEASFQNSRRQIQQARRSRQKNSNKAALQYHVQM
jgi:hypothetical protein